MPDKRTLAGLVLLALVGCGGSENAIEGTVNVNNAPLKSGFITFYPVEGTKAIVGAEVIDGKYRAAPVHPGKHRAVVAGSPQVSAVPHANGPTTLKLLSPATSLSLKSPGNNQIVEIQPGEQRLDFALRIATTSTRH